MTVKEILDRLEKFPQNLVIKHHTSSGFVKDIRDCRIVSNETNIDTDNDSDSDSSFICIY